MSDTATTFNPDKMLVMLPDYPELSKNINFENFARTSQVTITYTLAIGRKHTGGYTTTNYYPFRSFNLYLSDFLDPEFVHERAKSHLDEDVNTLRKITHDVT